ncbi:MAG: ATP synthase F1 subunit delta [Bacteroidota bacterium]
MVEDRIGYRYAKSIFGLAKEKDLLEEVRDDMQMVHDLNKTSRDFASMLKSPVIPPAKKKAVVEQLFKGKFKSQMSEYLVDIVLRKGREQYLGYISKSFLDLYDIEKHIRRGKLTSAVPLDAAQVEKIKSAVESQTGDSFEVEVEVDPALIGGFVLQVGDRLFDGSVASSLQQLKQEFSKNTFVRTY